MNDLTFRPAARADVPDIVRMLADDMLGKQREKTSDPLPEEYYQAFDVINRDPNHELIVADAGEIVGTLHLILLPSLSYQGGVRAQIESVRIDSKYRGEGLGSQMLAWAIERAKLKGAHVIQLTTEKSRTGAHRFYERLGFKASHLGMKLSLK